MEMIKDLEHIGHFTAPQGYEIVHKTEKEIRTTSLWLGKGDSIENYILEKIEEVENVNN